MAGTPRSGPAIAAIDRAGSALATAVIVIGVGLAPDGLLLAGAGLMLALIVWERFKQAHGRAIEAMRVAAGSDDPEQRARTRELARISTLAMAGSGLCAGLAFGLVQSGSAWTWCLGPAAAAVLIDLWGTHRMRAALVRFSG